MITPHVDDSYCQGHGRCYRLAPNVFFPVDSEGHAGVSGGVAEDDAEGQAALGRALNVCPESAIALDAVTR